MPPNVVGTATLSDIPTIISRQLVPAAHVSRKRRLGLRPCLCKLSSAPFRDLMFTEG